MHPQWSQARSLRLRCHIRNTQPFQWLNLGGFESSTPLGLPSWCWEGEFWKKNKKSTVPVLANLDLKAPLFSNRLAPEEGQKPARIGPLRSTNAGAQGLGPVWPPRNLPGPCCGAAYSGSERYSTLVQAGFFFDEKKIYPSKWIDPPK